MLYALLCLRKKSNQLQPSSPSEEAGEFDDLPETLSLSVLQDLLKALECMLKIIRENRLCFSLKPRVLITLQKTLRE